MHMNDRLSHGSARASAQASRSAKHLQRVLLCEAGLSDVYCGETFYFVIDLDALRVI